MTVDALGSIGELVAAIATVATLFYLAMQIRHGTEATRAASQQALLDTFFDASWDFGRDRELARVVGAGLVAFDSLDDRDKTTFSLTLGRFVGNLEKGLRMRAAGLIDQETLDGVGGGLVASIRSPGGAQWWESYRTIAPPIVIEYLDRRVADPEDPQIAWDEQFPYWARWASSANATSREPGA